MKLRKVCIILYGLGAEVEVHRAMAADHMTNWSWTSSHPLYPRTCYWVNLYHTIPCKIPVISRIGSAESMGECLGFCGVSILTWRLLEVQVIECISYDWVLLKGSNRFSLIIKTWFFLISKSLRRVMFNQRENTWKLIVIEVPTSFYELNRPHITILRFTCIRNLVGWIS